MAHGCHRDRDNLLRRAHNFGILATMSEGSSTDDSSTDDGVMEVHGGSAQWNGKDGSEDDILEVYSRSGDESEQGNDGRGEELDDSDDEDSDDEDSDDSLSHQCSTFLSSTSRIAANSQGSGALFAARHVNDCAPAASSGRSSSNRRDDREVLRMNRNPNSMSKNYTCTILIYVSHYLSLTCLRLSFFCDSFRTSIAAAERVAQQA